jgi:hypothetical protein
MSLAQVARAALNAGDDGLTEPLAGNTKPPPAAGSGKSGTPLARMHLANASAPAGPALGAVESELVAREQVAVLDSRVFAAR